MLSSSSSSKSTSICIGYESSGCSEGLVPVDSSFSITEQKSEWCSIKKKRGRKKGCMSKHNNMDFSLDSVYEPTDLPKCHPSDNTPLAFNNGTNINRYYTTTNDDYNGINDDNHHYRTHGIKSPHMKQSSLVSPSLHQCGMEYEPLLGPRLSLMSPTQLIPNDLGQSVPLEHQWKTNSRKRARPIKKSKDRVKDFLSPIPSRRKSRAGRRPLSGVFGICRQDGRWVVSYRDGVEKTRHRYFVFNTEDERESQLVLAKRFLWKVVRLGKKLNPRDGEGLEEFVRTYESDGSSEFLGIERSHGWSKDATTPGISLTSVSRPDDTQHLLITFDGLGQFKSFQNNIQGEEGLPAYYHDKEEYGRLEDIDSQEGRQKRQKKDSTRIISIAEEKDNQDEYYNTSDIRKLRKIKSRRKSKYLNCDVLASHLRLIDASSVFESTTITASEKSNTSCKQNTTAERGKLNNKFKQQRQSVSWQWPTTTSDGQHNSNNELSDAEEDDDRSTDCVTLNSQMCSDVQLVMNRKQQYLQQEYYLDQSSFFYDQHDSEHKQEQCQKQPSHNQPQLPTHYNNSMNYQNNYNPLYFNTEWSNQSCNNYTTYWNDSPHYFTSPNNPMPLVPYYNTINETSSPYQLEQPTNWDPTHDYYKCNNLQSINNPSYFHYSNLRQSYISPTTFQGYYPQLSQRYTTQYSPQLKKLGIPLRRIDPTHFYISRAGYRRFTKVGQDGQLLCYFRFIKSRKLRCRRKPSIGSYTVMRLIRDPTPCTSTLASCQVSSQTHQYNQASPIFNNQIGLHSQIVRQYPSHLSQEQTQNLQQQSTYDGYHQYACDQVYENAQFIEDRKTIGDRSIYFPQDTEILGDTPKPQCMKENETGDNPKRHPLDNELQDQESETLLNGKDPSNVLSSMDEERYNDCVGS